MVRKKILSDMPRTLASIVVFLARRCPICFLSTFGMKKASVKLTPANHLKKISNSLELQMQKYLCPQQQQMTSFVVWISSVTSDGTSALVTRGCLNATRRESLKNPQPLVPDQIYELTIKMRDTSWLFEKGHKIRISISSSEWPNMWPTPDPAINSIYWGSEFPSCLFLPKVVEREEELLGPEYIPPPHLYQTG